MRDVRLNLLSKMNPQYFLVSENRLVKVNLTSSGDNEWLIFRQSGGTSCPGCRGIMAVK